MRTGGRLAERLGKSAARSVLGREREMDLVVSALAEDGPVVTFVTGIGGIGKSSLLAAVEPRLVERGARVIRLDGRVTPPTMNGFLCALGATSVEDAAAAFEREAAPTVVLVDEYDRLRLLDPWLRHTLMPALPDATRWVLAGRLAPKQGWLATPGWSGAVRVVSLGSLDDESARALLARRGVSTDDMPGILALAHNNPLALELASRRGGVDGLAQLTDNAVLDALAERFVDDLSPEVRAAIDAMALLRRTTRPVLERMLGRTCDDAFFAVLAELPFVERTDDGLMLHDVVRDALGAQMHARDPVKKRDLEAKAWSALEAMLDSAEPNGPHAWRLTADVLFFVKHPAIREGFFPENETAVTVDAALPSDREAIVALIRKVRDGEGAAILERWWDEGRTWFEVARDADGKPVGFSIIVPSKSVPRALRESDPVARAWLEDVARSPGRERGALFARAIITDGEGDMGGDGRGALWLQAKRSYVESPEQWAFYVATRTPGEHLDYLSQLGFRDAGIEVDGVSTLVLEFGAKGIWTWLRGLVSAPSTAGWSLDDASRGLRVDGRAVALSPLEWGVIGELGRARGSVVTREELLDRVWKQRHTGSNVVDALVRLLRKKLGPHANDLETVKGHGYRLRST